jgi:hypothetical protein
MARVRDNTSVRYLIPSTQDSLEQWQLNAATDQFYELATQETNRPTLDTLIANTLTPKELKQHEPTLIYDSGWKDVT